MFRRIAYPVLAVALCSLSAFAQAKPEGQPRVVDPGQPGQAPSDAVVLFDGKDLSEWTQKDGRPAQWAIEKASAKTGKRPIYLVSITDEPRRIFEKAADRQTFDGALFGAGKTQKALRDVFAAFDFALDGREAQLHGLRGFGVTGIHLGEFFAQQIRVAGNDRERVVD